MPIDANGKYQMNPQRAKAVAPVASADQDAGQLETVTITPSANGFDVTIDGATQSLPTIDAVCDALKQEFGGEAAQDVSAVGV